tara:strand:+ start:232 stop:411 length:180 start_codon:yes stop_codon:yes gene_type:complete
MPINLITEKQLQENNLRAYEHYLDLIIKEIEQGKEYCQTKNLIIKELDYYYDVKCMMSN